MKSLSSRPTFALLLGLTLLAVGCSTDSPTEPVQNPSPSPTGSTASAAWNITVTANPNTLTAGLNEPSVITINVRRASDNSLPPNNTTMSLSTNLGDFNAFGSGQQSGVVTLISGQAQVSLFPGTVEGTATVTAQLEDSVGRANVSFSGSARFYLERLDPPNGTPNGGDSVNIFGGGFLEPVRVIFGDTGAEVLSVSSTQIRVRTPPRTVPVGTTQTVTVAVTNDVNGPLAQTDSLANAYTYTFGGATTSNPQVFSVTPRTGPNEGGTEVVISGTGFESPVEVLFGTGSSPAAFNGVEASVVSVSDSQIVVTAPPATGFGQNNTNSAVDILVRNRDSGLATIALAAFRYGVDVLITSIGPSAGPYFGGQLVTLFGQGFDEPLSAGLAGFGQQVISVTGTEVIVRTVSITTTSCDDVSGPSSITNIENGDGALGPDYNYQVVVYGPSISSVNPNSGPAAGGTNVTILGANFRNPMQVTFSDRPGSVSVIDEGQIDVITPFVAESAFATEPCDDNGDGFEGERLVPLATDIVVTNLATTCSAEFPEGFVYDPPSTTCNNDVGPPPVAGFTTSISGLTVLFTDTSSNGPTGWSWDFGDGGTSTFQNPSHTYGAAGTYTVRLTASNQGGSDQAVQQIVVEDPGP